MAKQTSHVKFQGTVGGVTYSYGPNGYKATEKKPVSKAKFETDRFKRFREHGLEFATAGRSGKLLRSSIKDLLPNFKERTTTQRLTALMMQIVRADNLNNRGERRVLPLQSEMLQGFHFNKSAILSDVLKVAPVPTIDRATGTLKISIPAFGTSTALSRPDSATHFQLVAAGMEIDFEEQKYNSTIAQSARVAVNTKQVTLPDLITSVPAGSTHPLFLVLGISFFEIIDNGDISLIRSGVYDALTILKVSGS